MIEKLKHGDVFLLHWLNDSIKCKILDLVMPIVTYLGSVTFSAIFCLVTLLSENKDIKHLGILTSLSILTSTFITHFIKRFINRIRPYINFPHLNIKKIGVDDYSFPSGHTTAAFSIGVSIALCYTSIAIIALALSLLVGVSRVYLGVHYPSDVAAGVFVGTFSSYCMFLVL
ncbi:phosphatase PAP2 family protein [Clostridium sp. UBA4548]|uniref:phosphatase PAP2 family protein n=1 Tax=Clostridium sp. UBA4548 TaxID=1946361 RepID=UPI0025BA81B0|nr:phosphatase PAP2 family protein [Clostridium sp. UBA4548]